MYLIQKMFFYSTSVKDYFKFNLSTRKSIQISIEEYCGFIFGKYDYKFRKLLENSNSINPEKIYSTFYQKPDLLIFDRNGDLIEKKENYFNGYTPYDIQVIEDKNEIWMASGSAQVVICYEIESGKIIRTIGNPYEDESELSYPESINVFNDNLYISEMGNKKVSRINLSSGIKSNYLEFKEPIWSFQKNEFSEIALLDSGIYEIKDQQLIKIGN